MHKILRSLMISDLFILSSYSLVQPVFAIYILKSIPDATITSVGVALSVALFTRSVFQILIAKWTDEEKGNKRELYSLLVGSLLISIVPIGFALSSSIIHIYLAQFVYGFSQALSYPSWRVLFSRFIRNDKAGFEWGVYDTITSLGMAAAAAIGAYFAEQYSFSILFVIVSVFSFIGTGFIVHMFKEEMVREGFFHK